MRYREEIDKNSKEIESKLQNMKNYIPHKWGRRNRDGTQRQGTSRDSNRVCVIMQIQLDLTSL